MEEEVTMEGELGLTFVIIFGQDPRHCCLKLTVMPHTLTPHLLNISLACNCTSCLDVLHAQRACARYGAESSANKDAYRAGVDRPSHLGVGARTPLPRVPVWAGTPPFSGGGGGCGVNLARLTFPTSIVDVVLRAPQSPADGAALRR